MDKIEVTQADIDAWEIYGPKIFHCEMTGPEALAARLATRTDATPVAWMDFNTLEVAIGEGLIMDLDMDDDNDLARIEWVSTSIANRICKAGNTAATDVAALVDAAKALVQQVGLQNTRVYRTDPAMQSLIAALAPFTKGQP